MPSFVNLPANSCRGFPFTGFGNPRRIATGETCLFLLWCRLRGGVRGIHLTHCFYKTLNAVVRQFACKFLPMVPVYGIRQSPAATDRHHTILGYNGKRYFSEQVFACLFLLWYRLRGDVRGNSLAVARQFACKFLPMIPVYGIRQSPKNSHRRLR